MGDKKDPPPLARPHFHLLPKIIDGGVAGIIGVSAVFPLDLVKTRLQNQIITPDGQKQYKNMLDCFIKTYKQEGFFGMYRGAGVNIVLIMPEKAIKLASFDYFRYNLTLPDGSQPLSRIALAGGFAGSCHCFITCPMELLKIQLQDAGRVMAQAKKEGKSMKRISAVDVARKIVKEHGFLGLFRGLTVCAIRDIYFSVVYFPVFIWFNRFGQTPDGGPAPFWWTFMGGFLGGTSSALAVNPFDVVKTRLQTIAKGKYDREYKGMVDCFVTTYKNEGLSAFTKGIGCRVAVVAPLFGILQAVYYLGVGEWVLGLPRDL